MKSLYIFMIGGLLFLILPSCHKSKSGGAPHCLSVIQPVLGLHRFHVTSSGFNPALQQYVTDTFSVTDSIKCIDTGLVATAGGDFVYDSTTTTGIMLFSYNGGGPGYGVGGGWGYMHFDQAADSIYINENNYISAGGGFWEYTYSSY